AWIMSTPIGVSPDFFHLPESLAEKRWPNRADLDKVSPRNPVCIPVSSYWPHPVVFNSVALSLLGVTRDTPNEPGVRIDKDRSGQPTGVIYGINRYVKSALQAKLQPMLPTPAPELQLDGMRRVFQQNMAVGLTAVYEGHGFNPRLRDQFQQLRASG